MFWGLEMEPAKVYRQKVEKPFHISMACLQPNECRDSNFTSLTLRKDETEFVLCNLQKDEIIQVQLDLVFGTGDEIAFTLTGGKNKVYLSGYLVDDEDDDLFNESGSEVDDTNEEVPMLVEGKRKAEQSSFESTNKKAKLKPEQSDDDSDESDDDEDDKVTKGDSDEDESDDEQEDDDEEDDEEEEDEEDESGSDSDDESDSDEVTPMKVAITKSPDKGKNKSPAVKQQQLMEKKQQTTPFSTPDSQINGKTPKSKKKNKGNTPGSDTNTATPKGQKSPVTPKETTPQKIKLEGGVIALDTQVGSGPIAKAGKKVAVYYTGRLQQNNKQFDSSTQGKGFVFKLGCGEVIKGWDIGITGMKVGGKRKITIPAPLAYGNKGSPPVIPPNAILVFDVELKNVH